MGMDITQYTAAQLRKILADADEKERIALVRRMLKDTRVTVQGLAQSVMNQLARQEALMQKFTDMTIEERAAWGQGYRAVAGMDEVGRGPLAGPVVTACVVWPPDECLIGVDDSKKLSPEKREELFPQIMDKAVAVGIGRVNNDMIDRINILEATKLAMVNAVDDCRIRPDYLLVDAVNLTVDMPCRPLIKGDQRSFAIAAASIVAKVVRDREMVGLHDTYPHYEWDKNKGYGSPAHVAAIKKHGPSPIHRMSFLQSILSEEAG
jgi:ribonuclease HII